MKNDNYFMFKSANPKLSREDLANILVSEIKNTTLNSDLHKNEYFWLQYLSKYNNNFSDLFYVYSKKLVDTDTYISKFYFTYSLEKQNVQNIEKAARTKLFNRLNEEDIETICKAWPHAPKSNEQILDYYINIFSNQCIRYYDDNLYDEMFSNFLSHLRTYQEAETMRMFTNRIYDFYHEEFDDCVDITNKYVSDETIRSQYNDIIEKSKNSNKEE